jgi:hypothetical protein
MSKKQSFGAAAALMILLFAASASAQQKPAAQKPPPNIPELEAEAHQAYQDENWVRVYSSNMKLHNARPFVPEYMINIVLAAASLDRKSTAYHYMVQMQSQGLSYDFNNYEETTGIRGTEAYDYVNDLLISAGEPAGEGSKFLELELAPADLGDVAWDAGRSRFLVGTRSEGKLLAVDDEGGFELLLQANEENGLWSIDGLAVDAANNRLWVASTATPAFQGFTPADTNRGALFEFDLATLEPVGRYNLPVDSLHHELGSVAVSASGDVYVIDRITPLVYRKAAGTDRLEPFAGGPQLVALTDLAITPDGSRLFVADAVLGILVIDPRARRSVMLTGPDNLNLSGIYNIEFSAGQLIVTQSGISPQRIVRLGLNPNGAAAESVAPMASSLDGYDTPGVGAVRENNLYYFANHGSQDAGKLLLMSTPLAAGSEIKPPEMEQLQDALRQSNKKAAEQ